MTDYDASDKARLKETVATRRGYWHQWHQGLLDFSPAYLQAYLDFHEPPFTANRLGTKLCEFIYIAVDAAVSHLFTPGVEMHIAKVLTLGATPEEIVEVIQLAMLAAHSTHTAAMPILQEELARAGLYQAEVERPLTAAEQAAKTRYVAATGHWPDGADVLFKLSPEFAKGFLSYGEIPYATGPLSARDKELICIALYASPVAPQAGPLRLHIRRALELGVTPYEIGDALQLSSAIAIHTCASAVPILVEALAAQAAANHE